MLDKSVPFHSIIMKRPYGKAPEPIALPKGYRLRSYQPGDEIPWAEIETSVLEFDSLIEAENCHKGYLSHLDALKRRQWFVESPEGILVSTATGWFLDSPNGRIPVVHALSCRPEYQGHGFGRAVAIQMLHSLYELDENRDVWLDTQTWSYKAIQLYLSLGFVPLRTAVYNETPNEYEAALPILKEHMRREYYEQFVHSTI